MKKILTVLFCLIISVSLFAQTDVRSYGMGGYHVTDYSDVYTTLKNPASLAYAKKHSLYTNIQLDISGPLDKYVEIADAASKEESDFDPMTVVSDIVTEQNGLNTSVRATGPLAFGFTNNGFGLLFTEDIYVDAVIPSVTMANVNVGLKADLAFGYGMKLDFGVNDLALGVSAKGTAKVMNVGINGSISQVFDAVENIETLPITTSLGYSISVGAHYSFANFLHLGVVWNDVFAPTYTMACPFYSFDEESELPEFSLKDAERVIKPSSLAVGVGIKIPTGFTFGVISSWTAYVDHENVFEFFKEDNLRNPLLGLNVGTEIELFKTILLRVGMNDSYLSAGCGLKLGVFRIDAALFGSELGLEPGSKPNLNAALSISFQK